MRLLIDGQAREFMPIQTFRAEHDLPPEFGVALFEPKDYTGLGRIDHAGAELNSVRQAVLDAIPAHLPLHGWIATMPQLQNLFRVKLYEINMQVGLRDVEIDFAAAGFGDVCQAVLYAMLRARNSRQSLPAFPQIYGEWLDSTTRVSQAIHPYTHQGQAWQVQIVTHAYGRAGLIVQADSSGVFYVQDAALGCPAEGFMAALLAEVAARVVAATM
jgi:hypothetical protein